MKPKIVVTNPVYQNIGSFKSTVFCSNKGAGVGAKMYSRNITALQNFA